MSEFKPGDIVDITIKGARVRAWRPEVSELTVESKADANSDLTTYDYASAQVEVERVAPAEWPPRPGDVWLDAEGRAWTALRGRMFPVTSTRGESADAALAIYGPLTLVHREDERGGGATEPSVYEDIGVRDAIRAEVAREAARQDGGGSDG